MPPWGKLTHASLLWQYSSTSLVQSVHYLYGDPAARNITYPSVGTGVEQRETHVCTKYLQFFFAVILLSIIKRLAKIQITSGNSG